MGKDEGCDVGVVELDRGDEGIGTAVFLGNVRTSSFL